MPLVQYKTPYSVSKSTVDSDVCDGIIALFLCLFISSSATCLVWTYPIRTKAVMKPFHPSNTATFPGSPFFMNTYVTKQTSRERHKHNEETFRWDDAMRSEPSRFNNGTLVMLLLFLILWRPWIWRISYVLISCTMPAVVLFRRASGDWCCRRTQNSTHTRHGTGASCFCTGYTSCTIAN